MNTIAICILLGSFLFLLAMRTPISFALLTSSILTSIYLQLPLMSTMVQLVKGIHSFSLMAIPFFIFAGEIMGQGGLSVGKLFLGGMVPGITLGIALMIVSYVIAVKRNYPKGEKISLREALKVTADAILGLMTAIIIIGGVIGGVFTATESAAIACLYAFIITFFVYREIPLRAIGGILDNSLKTLSMVLALLACCNAFGWLLAYLQVPALVTSALLGISSNRIVLLLLINLLLLALGCVMDMAPLIMITTPILLPVIQSIGMDPIQFGIMMILNFAIGLCTPPVGAVPFVGCSIGKISIEKVTRSLLPFYFAMIVVLLMVTFIPQISLFVPNLLMP